MGKIIINPNIMELDNFLDFADEQEYYFEIFSFCDPSILDSEEKIQEHIEIYKRFDFTR